jgi:hypothetical protein
MPSFAGGCNFCLPSIARPWPPSLACSASCLLCASQKAKRGTSRMGHLTKLFIFLVIPFIISAL